MKTLIKDEILSPAGQQIAWFLKNVGLDSDGVHLHEVHNADLNLRFSVMFAIPLNMHYSTSETVDSYISSLRERIRNSDEVTRMVMDIEVENKKLKEQVYELKTQVLELTPFKHHFETEMKLRHGDRLTLGFDGLPVRSGLR